MSLRCLFGHKWGEWEWPEPPLLNVPSYFVAIAKWRTCTRCSLREQWTV